MVKIAMLSQNNTRQARQATRQLIQDEKYPFIGVSKIEDTIPIVPRVLCSMEKSVRKVLAGLALDSVRHKTISFRISCAFNYPNKYRISCLISRLKKTAWGQ